ncbi:hypothetical protein CVT24_006125 [Panaeolus cyanescens]|uniref:Protein-S-isoprenylcysteine O-methyltransferase n=1 Tax=Panaeolus cyanescens TaxID=181874 RepID=A0A409YDT3_9AGAR|nr:hypothetical protein CVT24_006125 [Panaeolus cyanescens]
MLYFDDALKIIISAIGSYLFYKAYRPPHAPMDAKERDANVKGAMENRFWSQYLVILKAHTQLFLGIIEISAMLLKNWPSLIPFPVQSLLSFPEGNVERLHFSTLHVIGGLMIIMGGAIRVWAISALGHFFRFQVGIQKDHRLIKHGLYAVVRHPSYMGMQLTHIGSLLWHLTPGSWVRESGVLNTYMGLVLLSAYFCFIVTTFYTITIARMRQEDKVIQQAFGKEWEEWAKTVPYRVMPGVY